MQLAIVPVNVAYLAYTQGWGDLPRPHARMRGIAELYAIPLHLIATEQSGIRKWTDIRGRRIGVGAPNSTTEATVRMILEGLNLTIDDIKARWVNGDRAVKELRDGKVDAVFHRGNDPPSTVPKLLQVPGVRVIPISRTETEAIRSRHPFLRPATTPAEMYGNLHEIETIGVESVVVCRDDLPEELAYSVTRAVFETLAQPVPLTRIFQRVDLRQTAATPIPLHAGAARYFRERQLFE